MWRRSYEVRKRKYLNDNLSFFLISSVENLTKECLGYAEDVYEHVLVSLILFTDVVLFEKFLFRVKRNLHLLKVVKILNQ